MKIGRNQPCPCGSGLKYKKCCIDLTPRHQYKKWPATFVDDIKYTHDGGNDHVDFDIDDAVASH